MFACLSEEILYSKVFFRLLLGQMLCFTKEGNDDNMKLIRTFLSELWACFDPFNVRYDVIKSLPDEVKSEIINISLLSQLVSRR